MVKESSIVSRIHIKMYKKLLDVKRKNNLEGKGVLKASELTADILDGVFKRRKVVENIRREIEF